ncbi:AGE family epimerase/isomerase [Marinilabiliaceae bacterium ANBcel2]|nr:AGE family epimerase/isomerase [Marinilabiliaceae bacterium ANBcel2]
MQFSKISTLFASELFENVLPFWLNHSLDREHGGYFTCLDRDGRVYDTDKFIWLQARQVWMFSMLYNKVEARKEWLDTALLGGEFLKKYGHDGDFNWYFSLTKKGEPLVQPYNIFSYTFAAMAFGQLAKAANNSEYSDIALKTYERILNKQDNPKGIYNKQVNGTRPLRNFSLPMILSNLTLEIEDVLGSDRVDALSNQVIKDILDDFYMPEFGLVAENINFDGTFSDTFDGRLINPGHGLEAMWFVMDLAERLDRPDLMEKAVDIALQTIEYGWDKRYGGIFYFMDIKSNPTQQLEWNQKLWWVHIEAMIAMLKGFYHTGHPQCRDWFEKVFDYSWSRFRDDKYGEWYGYLDRYGNIQLNLKGGKWKGCFHVPRGLYQCWDISKKISGQ